MTELSSLHMRLRALASNLYWSWSRETHAPFLLLSPEGWKATRSPWRVLESMDPSDLSVKEGDSKFLHTLEEAESALEAYLSDTETWYQKSGARWGRGKVAYFCAEFGLHESFPIYSGGLGILAGDHMKTASDMGLPLVGVGLLYRCGYVTQQVDGTGWQQDHFETLSPEQVPVERALNRDGQPAMIHVPIGNEMVSAAVFKVQVGRIPVYLLDTDVPENSEENRAITRNLYGGGVETRIRQEIVLGMGGVRALHAVGEDIAGFHMNEGHAAFLGLELALRERMGEPLTLTAAFERISSRCAFTTHTPVDAGHDRFSPDLVLEMLAGYVAKFGLSPDELLGMGRAKGEGDDAPFNMTHLALYGSQQRNGVSQLHGAISREMFQGMWPEKPLEEVPIGGITNGTHIHSWLSKSMREALACIAGRDWKNRLHDKGVWEASADLDDKTLLSCHGLAKKALIALIHERENRRWERLGQPERALPPLDPNALTIGFARRFAPYKRATLLLQDRDRLLKLLHDSDRPVQFVFAGKCHPANQVGKGLLQQIDQWSREPEFNGKIRFVEGYDMELGRALVSGVDVWMNTPQRPREASGTSGMKAAMNGVPSLSILDGWWCEGYNGKNGWAFGMTEADVDPDHRDHVDGLALFETLENEVIPCFFQSEKPGTSQAWLSMMKESIRVGVTDFNTERMLAEYAAQMYRPLYRSSSE